MGRNGSGTLLRATGRGRMFDINPRAAFFTLTAIGAVTFALFWKGKLPEAIAKPVGRITLLPQLPFTIFTQLYVRNWWDELVPGSKIYIGGLPLGFMGYGAEQLRKLGVTGVVNMCDEFAGPVDEYKKYGIQQLYLPTVDHMEPTLENIKKAVAFIQEHYEKKEGVYIHCKGGVGRSGEVAFAWLLTLKKMDLPSTQAYISGVRMVSKTLYKKPNIIAFYKELHKGK